MRKRTDNRTETTSALRRLTGTTCDRNREHSPLIDFHIDLFEAGDAHELIHFGRRSPPHNPALPFPVNKDVRYEFELRMPGLIRVNDVSTRLDRVRQAAQ